MSKHKKQRRSSIDKLNFSLKQVTPLTHNQERAFESSKEHLVLHGLAGTGKSFIGLYLGLEAVENAEKHKVVIIRSAVPTRDVGFLPGNLDQKAQPYEDPYKPIVNGLYHRDDAYEILSKKKVIQFLSTSFLRGVTIDNAVIIVEECQNMSFHELDTVMTRTGKNCTIIFNGDFRQSDLKGNGLKEFFKIIKSMKSSFEFIDFKEEDIVRSSLVKDYIITKQRVLDESGKEQSNLHELHRRAAS